MPAGIDYVIVSLLGAAVGLGEIVSRYRDAPWKAARSRPAVIYVGLNAVAAVSALALVQIFDLTLGQTEPNKVRAVQALAAGFGAIALFRSSLFVARVGGRDIGVGPVTVLQVLLAATDRIVDRVRAVQRANAMSKTLRDVSFLQVRDALPRYCLTLMQNVSRDEEAEIWREVGEISSSEMEDGVKVNALGLSLMNIVGEDVLLAAARSIRGRIIKKGVLGEVYPRLLNEIKAHEQADTKRLDVLGLTLYTAWPNIRSWLEDDAAPLTGWTIVLRVLDPKMPADVCGAWLDERWLAEAQEMIDEVDRFVSESASKLNELQIDITVKRYSIVPSFHGFRLGRGSYFISFVHWDAKSGKLARPHHPYEHLAADDSSARAEQYRGLFENWLVQIDGAEPASSVSSQG